jgi:hypothetical protein
MGGLLGMVMAAQPNTPIARLVVNDVGPAIEPAALVRIGGYLGTDPAFESFEAIEAYVRTISRPSARSPTRNGRMSRARTCAGRGGPLAHGLRPGDRGAVSRQSRPARRVVAVGQGALPDAGAAGRPVGSAERTDRGRDDGTRPEGTGGRDRRYRHAPMLMDPAQVEVVAAFFRN